MRHMTVIEETTTCQLMEKALCHTEEYPGTAEAFTQNFRKQFNYHFELFLQYDMTYTYWYTELDTRRTQSIQYRLFFYFANIILFYML